MKQLKWTTTSEWVDVETGEVITKENAKQNYNITRKIKKYEYDKNHESGRTKITNECRKSTQLKIF